jgi:hypothetical protein
MDEYCGHNVIVINGGSEGLGAYLGMAGRLCLSSTPVTRGAGKVLVHTCWLRVRHWSASEPPAQRMTSGRWVSTWNSASSIRPGCCGYSGPIAGPQAAEPEPDGHVPT